MWSLSSIEVFNTRFLRQTVIGAALIEFESILYLAIKWILMKEEH